MSAPLPKTMTAPALSRVSERAHPSSFLAASTPKSRVRGIGTKSPKNTWAIDTQPVEMQRGYRSLSTGSRVAEAYIELYAYSPYGTQTILDATGTDIGLSAQNNPYGFTGRRLDEETGLWYFRARYFDSELGRFISRDPIGYTDSQNLYQYVNGMPLVHVDPTGQFIPLVIGGVAFSAATVAILVTASGVAILAIINQLANPSFASELAAKLQHDVYDAAEWLSRNAKPNFPIIDPLPVPNPNPKPKPCPRPNPPTFDPPPIPPKRNCNCRLTGDKKRPDGLYNCIFRCPGFPVISCHTSVLPCSTYLDPVTKCIFRAKDPIMLGYRCGGTDFGGIDQ